MIRYHTLNIEASVTETSRPVLQGTLDLLVLKTLSWGPRHGYAIARWLEETTGDVLRVEEGSLYPALYRMQKRGWIRSEWDVSDAGKRIRVYALTPAGRTELRAQLSQWDAVVTAMARVLRPS
jgi:PadR family transcriptional regulator PadR